jgi:hypothetical protein
MQEPGNFTRKKKRNASPSGSTLPFLILQQLAKQIQEERKRKIILRIGDVMKEALSVKRHYSTPQFDCPAGYGAARL